VRSKFLSSALVVVQASRASADTGSPRAGPIARHLPPPPTHPDTSSSSSSTPARDVLSLHHRVDCPRPTARLPWHRPSRDRNPISQQSSTPVALPAAEKKVKIGRVLFEQIGPEGLVQTGSSFCTQGHPPSLRMVPFDRRQNFLYFLFPRSYANFASFWGYGINTRLQKTKVGCYSNVP